MNLFSSVFLVVRESGSDSTERTLVSHLWSLQTHAQSSLKFLYPCRGVAWLSQGSCLLAYMFPVRPGDSPGGRRLQPHTGDRLPHGQQDLDVSEWRGHSSGTRTVAILHRNPRECGPALPVGAHLQGH